MLSWSIQRTLYQTIARHQVAPVRWKTISTRGHLITKHQVKQRSEKKLSRKFVDFKRVEVQGGDGGTGCVSFLSVFANEFAGPDGGDGGNGGHVIFRAESNTKSLVNLYSILKADDGKKGRNKHCHGKNADHTYIPVPPGTLFRDKNEVLLHDLKKEGDLFLAARGGAGGHGNKFFATPENTTPTSYEEGGRGERRILLVELSVMAHVGLVGFPNAGKSTLLQAISRARPKVAEYPFTTLNPHVGIVEYEDYEQVAVADIPGLIRGAHLNHGLGFAFLRHIQRCMCLLYVIDLSVHDPWTQLDDLRYELEKYKPGLSMRPHAIVANKLDLEVARENLAELRDRLGDMPVFPISAKYKEDITPLLAYIRHLYDTHSKDNG